MKLSEFIKKETDALSEKYVLEAAEADADTNTAPVLIRGTKMHTFKNVLTTAACAVLVVAIAVSALVLPGILTGDTTPGDVVDEETTVETEFTPETLQNGTQLEYNGEYQYKIFGEQVSIYSYNGDATEITIPQEIDGCKVWFLDARKGTPDDGVGILPISVIEGTDVTSVTIEGGIRGVRMYAFYNSQNLETLVFKDISYDIGIDYGAFQNCTNLKSVTFAEGVTDIRLYAFRGCTSLKEITIPASVIEIGSEAFADCTSLEKVTFLSSETVVAEDAFLNTPYQKTLEDSKTDTLSLLLQNSAAEAFRNAGFTVSKMKLSYDGKTAEYYVWADNYGNGTSLSLEDAERIAEDFCLENSLPIGTITVKKASYDFTQLGVYVEGLTDDELTEMTRNGDPVALAAEFIGQNTKDYILRYQNEKLHVILNDGISYSDLDEATRFVINEYIEYIVIE